MALHGVPLAHSSILVDDLDAASGFLTAVMGFRVIFGPVGIGAQMAALVGAPCGDTRLIQLGDGAAILELIACPGVEGSAAGRPPRAHAAFVVPDLDAAIARAVAAGARPMGAIVAFAEGRAAYLVAPGGLAVELEELTP